MAPKKHSEHGVAYIISLFFWTHTEITIPQKRQSPEEVTEVNRFHNPKWDIFPQLAT